MGGVHIGGESDPGEKNLQVEGKLQVAGVTSLNGGIEEKLSIFNKNLNTTVATILFKSRPMQPGETSAYLTNGELVFQTLKDGTMTSRMEISHDGHVRFDGCISEKLEIIHVTTDIGWGNPDQPIPQYFKAKLDGKPKGTLIRVLTDLDAWKNYYWEGWVGANGQINIMFHHP